MKILIACLDQEVLWAIDDVIGGLYSIDLRTFKTKYVIDFQKLSPQGNFEILSLFVWKKDYIVIVPLENDKRWIFYNKITGEIECGKIIEQKCREIMIAADSKRNQLYFFPQYTHDPILIVNLDTLMYSRMIKDWSSELPAGCLKTAWKGVYNGRYLYFPVKKTKILVRMDCGSQKVELLELNIPESIIGVDFAFEELWVLPARGNRIYQIDEDGLIVNVVELLAENAIESVPKFARIVVQKRYLFLLPYYRKGIYVYDKQGKKMQIIPEENISLEKKDKEVYLQYWEYCVIDNQICFLPYCEDYIEIDLNTLAYKKKKLYYPDIWSDEEKIKKVIWSHTSEINSIIGETDECCLNVFSGYIQYEPGIEDFLSHGYVGNGIWNMMKC